MIEMNATNATNATNLLLQEAELRCLYHGRGMTPQRRRIFELLLRRGGQATAYQLLDDMRAVSANVAPTSIYRSLYYLMETGLVRRVATTNTFMACGDTERQHEILMVCKHCGSVSVVHDEALRTVLKDAARTARFVMDGEATEIKGLCETCSCAC